MSSKYLFLVAVAFIVGGVFVWGLLRLPASTEAPSRFEEIKAILTAIPTPEGWYAWGITDSPSDPISKKTGAVISFGNVPEADGHNSLHPVISISGGSTKGLSPDEWIASHYWSTLPDLFSSATSTGKTWGVENGRLIFGSVDAMTEEIAARGDGSLAYFVFDHGIVYSFFIGGRVTPNVPIATSPEAEVLRTVVKRFADSLPPITAIMQ